MRARPAARPVCRIIPSIGSRSRLRIRRRRRRLPDPSPNVSPLASKKRILLERIKVRKEEEDRREKSKAIECELRKTQPVAVMLRPALNKPKSSKLRDCYLFEKFPTT